MGRRKTNVIRPARPSISEACHEHARIAPALKRCSGPLHRAKPRDGFSRSGHCLTETQHAEHTPRIPDRNRADDEADRSDQVLNSPSQQDVTNDADDAIAFYTACFQNRLLRLLWIAPAISSYVQIAVLAFISWATVQTKPVNALADQRRADE